MILPAMFQLFGMVCLSGVLCFISLLTAAYMRRWSDGLGAAAADLDSPLEG